MIFTCLLCGCQPRETAEESVGSFYTLQEAYNEGMLTIEDLQNIARYHITILTE